MPGSIYTPSHDMPRQITQYTPNQSLYDGYNRSLSDSEDEIHFLHHTPLSRNSSANNSNLFVTDSSMNLVTMIQEQQHILEDIQEQQKKMEMKQT